MLFLFSDGNWRDRETDNEKFMKRSVAKKKRLFMRQGGSMGNARGRRKGIYRKQTFAVLELTKLCTTCIKQTDTK